MLPKVICSAHFWANELTPSMILFQPQPVIPVSDCLVKKKHKTEAKDTKEKKI